VRASLYFFNMPQVKPIVKIHCAATYFVFVSRDINEIAETFDTSDRTIRRWTEDPEWETALDACGYTGDKSFETQPSRDLERESGDVIDLAKSMYHDARAAGMRKGEASKHTAKIVNVSEKAIFNWRKRFAWDE